MARSRREQVDVEGEKNETKTSRTREWAARSFGRSFVRSFARLESQQAHLFRGIGKLAHANTEDCTPVVALPGGREESRKLGEAVLDGLGLGERQRASRSDTNLSLPPSHSLAALTSVTLPKSSSFSYLAMCSSRRRPFSNLPLETRATWT